MADLPLFCTYCGRGFSRHEHLQRHIFTRKLLADVTPIHMILRLMLAGTDTNVRPFECHVCKLTFTRNDLLRKHSMVHQAGARDKDKANVGSKTPSELRLRNGPACVNCAKTKIKCDVVPASTGPNGTTTTTTTKPGSDAPDHLSNQHQADSEPADSNDALSASGSDNQGEMSTIPTESHSPPQPATHDMADQSAGSKDQALISRSTMKQQMEDPDDSFMHSLTIADPQVPLDLMDIDSSLQMDPQNNLSGGYTMFTLHANEDWESLMGMFGSIPDSPHLLSTHSNTTAKQDSFSKQQSKEPKLQQQGNHYSDHTSVKDQHDPSTTMFTRWADSQPFVPSYLPVAKTQVESGSSELPEQSLAATHKHAHESPDKPSTMAWPAAGLSVPTTSPLVLSPAQDSPIDNRTTVDFPKDVHHWTMLQCCPFDLSIAPTRAKDNLVYLERLSKNGDSWHGADGAPDGQAFDMTDDFQRTPVSLMTREKMSAIIQSFFRRALDMHGFGYTPRTFASQTAGGWFTSSTFILLPPPASIERFLYNYVQFTDPFYPLIPARHFDPNQLVDDENEQAATLMLLLMIASGAMMDSASRSIRFAAGLTEVSRIALSDILEKHNSLSTSELILKCALLFIVQAAWSGDKWQMDIGEGHRSMYIAMLRNSRYLAQQTVATPTGVTEQDLDALWKAWIKFESRNRLAYDWVLADQELCLFHGHPTKFSVAELEAPLPDKDELWLARNSEEWKQVLDHEDGVIQTCSEALSQRPKHSLRLLFQLFLDNDLNQSGLAITPLRLRLLLYPIQTLIQQYCQLLNIFSDSGISVTVSKTMTRTSSLIRVEEIQNLLQRWWSLTEMCVPVGGRQQRMTEANYILYHLISLDVHTSFKEMEAFARGCRPDWTSSRTPYTAERWIYAVPEALFHCGQILRLVRDMPPNARPVWWAAAIYRVTIVLWIYSLSYTFGPSQPAQPHPGLDSIKQQEPIQIDQVLSKDPRTIQFLKYNRGDPRLTKSDGTSAKFDSPSTVLALCIAAVDGGPGSSWFATGVKQKLEHLAKLWH
ncbi:hypothetical protein AYO21_00463 [Fonsecaea monophora]|uniref:C2H2-type domain-containing protein n=1 Tax=Fonsecaea monophora TaxID=254056 RepID=A0A177FLJ5_9EURO|nr:hypothetical protein AYO21_00463 [Fonsecaea monophora]OAG45115.1 hypothetical protein AYO21_00463 [Fonsecaea monophora]